MRKLIFLLLLMAVVSACHSVKTEYVPVVSTRTDSIYVMRTRCDTIMQTDSVYVLERGDTVRIERWRTRYSVRLISDTAYIERRDTIAVPYPVETKLTRWQQLKQEMGGVCIGLLLAIIVGFIVVWIVRRYRARS